MGGQKGEGQRGCFFSAMGRREVCCPSLGRSPELPMLTLNDRPSPHEQASPPHHSPSLPFSLLIPRTRPHHRGGRGTETAAMPGPANPPLSPSQQPWHDPPAQASNLSKTHAAGEASGPTKARQPPRPAHCPKQRGAESPPAPDRVPAPSPPLFNVGVSTRAVVRGVRGT